PLLPGANLRGCRLEDLDLRGKDLRGAQFQRASLVGADLRGADLRGADLSEADLTDARLSGANMRDVRLDRAILDQTLMDGVDLTGASFEQVQAQSVRGLDSVTRARIRAQAASHNEDRLTLASAAVVAGTLAAGMLLYLGVQWLRQDQVDPGRLEQAASDAQRTGRTDEASENFAALAAQQELPDQKVNFLLEAASAAEESRDPARTLELLELAMAAAAEGPTEVTVRLRLARAQARAELRTDAEAQYRALLDRIDLEPTQRAEALVGLAGTLAEGKDTEVTRLQKELLEGGATDLERSALALALADGWAAMARPEAALAAIQLALDLVTAAPERATLQLRQARLMVDSGDSDGALALYQKLMAEGGTSGMDARLGGAELLQRRGKGEESEALLKPLLESEDEDRKAYARIILASVVAARGDESEAVNLLKTVLASSSLSPRRMDEARLMLGRLLVRSDPDAAASLAAENPMLHEEMLLGQARALREAGQRAKAREIWVELVEGEKTSEDARTEAQLSLADLQLEEGDPEGALRRFEALLERTTTATLRQRIVLGMADALVRMGRLQEAEVKYEGLIPVAPEDLAMRCRLGLARTAALRGQNDRASRLYLEVAGMEGPWAVEALLSLAELRERSGDHSGAIQALRLARTRPGAEAERRTAVDIALAAILAEQGDPEATKLYATLLEAPDPGVRTQARLAVGQQLLTEDPALALTRFDEAISEAPTPELRAEARAGWLRASLATGQATAAVERAQAWLAAESDSQRRGELVLGVVAALHTEGRLDEAANLGERYLTDGGFELAMELS
ncbi:MAG TPA: pentapeptide repeat-containing protein, partial [Myxococcota bacterium]|nr:pentapeptide repeat-containing protein [Myxococcota bacterium]